MYVAIRKDKKKDAESTEIPISDVAEKDQTGSIEYDPINVYLLTKIIINAMFSVGYALAMTYMIGKWAIHFAYLERGYKAVGGEYFLVPMIFIASYKVLKALINILDEKSFWI